jgi:L-lactate utilization protein LutC
LEPAAPLPSGRGGHAPRHAPARWPGLDPAASGPGGPLDIATRPPDTLAADALTHAFLASLARRRATGEITDGATCAAACAAQLTSWGARRVLLPDDAWLGELGVPAAVAGAGIEVVTWPADRGWRELLGLDDAPLTCAVTIPTAAVAQRGTLVLESSPQHGRSVDAVGWWHLAVLRAEAIVPTLADALRETYRPGREIPSGVSLVSGPSRTSDVEKITTYGAHGALAEHVVVIEG